PPPLNLHLPPFPTRRSSDLIEEGALLCPRFANARTLAKDQRHQPLEGLSQVWLGRGYRRFRQALVSHAIGGNSPPWGQPDPASLDRKSTRLNSSHGSISYAV